MNNVFLIWALLSAAAFMGMGCAEEGEVGEMPLDCGEHGDAHGGHCHCEDGFLYDGVSCVAPEEITEICGEHLEEAETESSQHDMEAHGACRCPATGVCPCEHGELETVGGQDYCVPELHEE
jgi:hypothetical protein